MEVGLEKRYISSCKRLILEANRIARQKSSGKIQKNRYLLSNNISVENKKDKLVNALHSYILMTFAIKKISLSRVRQQAGLIRQLLDKLKGINNYLEETLLRDIGIIKKSLIITALKSGNPEKFLEKRRGLPKGYIAKIEHAVYNLMREIVFFDQKLLKNYGKKEFKAVENEKIEIKDIEKILRIETELLDGIEAKIPPPKRITARLFKKNAFNKWVPFIFALLANFEAECQKERLIFLKIKKNSRLRNKIEGRIYHIIREKEGILKIKEERALSMRSLGRISEDHRQAFHEYVSASEL